MTYIVVGIAVVSGVLYMMRRNARMKSEDNE
jgi:uncharacterized membrane protein YuzA (DUF378 family)